jgi:hypothetical protein
MSPMVLRWLWVPVQTAVVDLLRGTGSQGVLKDQPRTGVPFCLGY